MRRDVEGGRPGAVMRADVRQHSRQRLKQTKRGGGKRRTEESERVLEGGESHE